jgi:hypothetical protein
MNDITCIDYKTKEHAIKNIKAYKNKLEIIMNELTSDSVELLYKDYNEYTTVQAVEAYEHCYMFGFMLGNSGYSIMILCDDSWEGDALEELADILQTSGRAGYLKYDDDPDIGDDEIMEEYYPVNGGEYFIEYPAAMKKLY